MENNLSNWNGFKVQGDIAELDKIVENDGKISLDFNDITNTLSKNGENFVTVGLGANCLEAFYDAVLSLPVPFCEVEKLLIQFYVGARQPSMTEMSAISDILKKEPVNMQVLWGISELENIGSTTKVVLLSSHSL